METAERELPGYELIQRVAVGGRGEIFLARELSGLRRVAIKIVRSEDVGRPERIQAFMDEVALSCLLDHPNIVRVFHGDDERDGVPYLVMEFLDGVTLWELIEKAKAAGRQIPLGVAAYVTAMVGEALVYAHGIRGPEGKPLSVVHRDVSTVNVMATFDGAVKLLDFGIARSNMRSLHTAPGIIKGKLDYLSPEQCTGGPIDALTDVYSLGVVLFELLTLVRPFPETDVARRFEQVAKGQRPKVHDLRPDVSPRLERVVDKAMAPQRTARYASARAMLDDLRACMAKLAGVTTSSSLAALIGELLPDHVARAEESYGASLTTAIARAGEAEEPKTLEQVVAGPSEPPADAPDAEAGDEPAAVPGPALAAPEPAGPSPTPSPTAAPDRRAAPRVETSPVRPRAARVSAAGISERFVLPALAGLALLAVGSGAAVTLAVRPGRDDAAATAEPRGSAVAAVGTVRPPPRDGGPAKSTGVEPLRALPVADAGATVEPGASWNADADATAVAGARPTPDAEERRVEQDPNASSREPPRIREKSSRRRARSGVGYLTVTSKTPAVLFVGRRKVGVTPVVRLELSPGRYRLKARSRHGMQRRYVHISAGNQVSVRFAL